MALKKHSSRRSFFPPPLSPSFPSLLLLRRLGVGGFEKTNACAFWASGVFFLSKFRRLAVEAAGDVDQYLLQHIHHDRIAELLVGLVAAG